MKRLVTIGIALMVWAGWSAAASGAAAPSKEFFVYLDNSKTIVNGDANKKIADMLERLFSAKAEDGVPFLESGDHVHFHQFDTAVTQLHVSVDGDNTDGLRAALQTFRNAKSPVKLTQFDTLFTAMAGHLAAAGGGGPKIVLIASDFVHDQWDGERGLCDSKDRVLSGRSPGVSPSWENSVALLRPVLESHTGIAQTAVVMLRVAPSGAKSPYWDCFREIFDKNPIGNILGQMGKVATINYADVEKDTEKFVKDFTEGYRKLLLRPLEIDKVRGVSGGGQFRIVFDATNPGFEVNRVTGIRVRVGSGYSTSIPSERFRVAGKATRTDLSVPIPPDVLKGIVGETFQVAIDNEGASGAWHSVEGPRSTHPDVTACEIEDGPEGPLFRVTVLNKGMIDAVPSTLRITSGTGVEFTPVPLQGVQGAGPVRPQGTATLTVPGGNLRLDSSDVEIAVAAAGIEGKGTAKKCGVTGTLPVTLDVGKEAWTRDNGDGFKFTVVARNTGSSDITLSVEVFGEGNPTDALGSKSGVVVPPAATAPQGTEITIPIRSRDAITPYTAVEVVARDQSRREVRKTASAEPKAITVEGVDYQHNAASLSLKVRAKTEGVVPARLTGIIVAPAGVEGRPSPVPLKEPRGESRLTPDGVSMVEFDLDTREEDALLDSRQAFITFVLANGKRFGPMDLPMPRFPPAALTKKGEEADSGGGRELTLTAKNLGQTGRRLGVFEVATDKSGSNARQIPRQDAYVGYNGEAEVKLSFDGSKAEDARLLSKPAIFVREQGNTTGGGAFTEIPWKPVGLKVTRGVSDPNKRMMELKLATDRVLPLSVARIEMRTHDDKDSILYRDVAITGLTRYSPETIVRILDIPEAAWKVLTEGPAVRIRATDASENAVEVVDVLRTDHTTVAIDALKGRKWPDGSVEYVVDFTITSDGLAQAGRPKAHVLVQGLNATGETMCNDKLVDIEVSDLEFTGKFARSAGKTYTGRASTVDGCGDKIQAIVEVVSLGDAKPDVETRSPTVKASVSSFSTIILPLIAWTLFPVSALVLGQKAPSSVVEWISSLVGRQDELESFRPILDVVIQVGIPGGALGALLAAFAFPAMQPGAGNAWWLPTVLVAAVIVLSILPFISAISRSAYDAAEQEIERRRTDDGELSGDDADLYEDTYESIARTLSNKRRILYAVISLSFILISAVLARLH